MMNVNKGIAELTGTTRIGSRQDRRTARFEQGGEMSDDLTDQERKAIRSLEALARRWPDSLTLFGASGTLSVRKGGSGAQHEVTFIPGIRCDGGDGGDEF
jgi:hypothetical protein